MKKTAVLLAAISLVGASAFFADRQWAQAAEDYQVSGGKITVDFEETSDLSGFDLLTEHDREEAPRIVDGRLVCWSLAEQKIIYTERKYTDVDISVDIGTINDHGKFDAGIYVGIGDFYSERMDMITAWTINLERGANDSTYFLKLHRFNGTWLGAKLELQGLALPMNLVNLRVVVKDGVIHAFVNQSEQPYFSYEIGEVSGYVGFRSFYSPNTFDNVTIIGDANNYDYSELNALIAQAENIDVNTITAESGNVLTRALNEAKAAKNGGYSQYELDEIATSLSVALKGVTRKQDYSSLTALLAQAKALTNEGGSVYTQNSWQALRKVIAKCESLTAQTAEQELSYWANRLQYRMDSLIAYAKEGNA